MLLSGRTQSTPKKPVINRLDAHEYEKTIQNLLEKIDILEEKIKEIAQEKIVAISSSKIFEDQNELLKDELNSQKKNNINLVNANTDYAQQINDLKENQKIANDKSKVKINHLTQEIKDKDNNIKKLNETITKKNNKIKSISVDNRLYYENLEKNKNNLLKQLNINKSQNQKITDLEKEIADFFYYKKNEAQLLLEIHFLKEDNIRLLKMLNDTPEYRDFSYLVQVGTGGVRYIRPIEEKKAVTFKPISKKDERAKSMNDYKHLKEMQERKKEKDEKNWIPNDAYECIVKYFNAYNVNLEEHIINDLLVSLNKIWQDKAKVEMNHIRKVYQNEIKELKFKIDAKKNYNDIVNKSNNDLKISFNKEKEPSSSSGNKLLNEFFNTASNFKVRQNNLESENAFLRNKLNNKKEIEPRDKVKDYNQGSLYVAEMSLDEIKKVEKKLDEIYRQYENKVKFLIKDEYVLVNDAIKLYFNSVNDVIEGCKKKMNNWKVDIQRNLSGIKFNSKRY